MAITMAATISQGISLRQRRRELAGRGVGEDVSRFGAAASSRGTETAGAAAGVVENSACVDKAGLMS